MSAVRSNVRSVSYVQAAVHGRSAKKLGIPEAHWSSVLFFDVQLSKRLCFVIGDHGQKLSANLDRRMRKLRTFSFSRQIDMEHCEYVLLSHSRQTHGFTDKNKGQYRTKQTDDHLEHKREGCGERAAIVVPPLIYGPPPLLSHLPREQSGGFRCENDHTGSRAEADSSMTCVNTWLPLPQG
jgi:hypothetical protein